MLIWYFQFHIETPPCQNQAKRLTTVCSMLGIGRGGDVDETACEKHPCWLLLVRLQLLEKGKRGEKIERELWERGGWIMRVE